MSCGFASVDSMLIMTLDEYSSSRRHPAGTNSCAGLSVPRGPVSVAGFGVLTASAWCGTKVGGVVGWPFLLFLSGADQGYV